MNDKVGGVMRLRNGKGLRKKYVNDLIMKELGFTYKRGGRTVYQIQKYKRFYERTRNKLRNYERATGIKGKDRQSVKGYIYNQARFKVRLKREGIKYRPSINTKYIESFSSGRNANIESAKVQEATKEYISERYGKLMSRNTYALQIARKFKDPKERLQALNEYAKERQRLIKESKYGEANVDTIKKGEGGDTNEETDKEAYLNAIANVK